LKPDRVLINRVLKTGIALGLVVGGGASFWGTKAAAGVIAGAGISLGGFAFFAWLIPLACHSRKPRIWLGLAGIVKLPLLALLLYWLIAREWVNPVAFCAGISFLPIILTMNSLRANREAV
jgi:hypothetical protein